MAAMIFSNDRCLWDINSSRRSSYTSRRAFSAECTTHAQTMSSPIVLTKPQEVVIAMGSNMGDKFQNMNSALKMMRDAGINIRKHGCLYETAPMHYLNQPNFLNSAVSAFTDMEPHKLLQVLKEIEAHLGRTKGERYGPRPIDLDIIFYGDINVHSEDLQVPHPMFSQRPFVMAPVMDVLGTQSTSWSRDRQLPSIWSSLGGEECIKREGMKRLIPIGGKLLDLHERTYVMGILNVTPDSFSDGGKFLSPENAVKRVKEMIDEGADFIDIGAQSTRPNATRLSTNEELDRVLPVLEAIKNIPGREKVYISIDTFDSNVAKEAVKMGVDIVNDVSAGNLDSNMLSTIVDLEVPCILMHMRGDPCTMMNETNTKYESLPTDIARELKQRIEDAEAKGIPSWRIIADPGFGFAKKYEQNLELLGRLGEFRRVLGSGYGVLVGVSRKGFLGKFCGIPRAEERDYATVAASTVAVLNGANIVRAHNVKAVHDAVLVIDSVRKYTH